MITGGPRWAQLYEKLRPDAIMTREMGKPAYAALRQRGVAIYYADAATLREAAEKLRRTS